MSPLSPELASLLELQRRDTALAEGKRRQGTIPAKRRALAEALDAARADLARTKHDVEAIRLERRKLEKEAEAFQAEAARLERQLFDVKTNDEFKAMQHQIAGVKERRSGVETAILEGMEREEALTAVAKDAAEAVASAERAKAEGDAALDAEHAALEAEIAERTSARDAGRAGIAPAVLARYDRLLAAREGIAVAELTNGACGGCHRSLTPHDLQVVRQGDTMHSCEGCGRIVIDLDAASR